MTPDLQIEIFSKESPKLHFDVGLRTLDVGQAMSHRFSLTKYLKKTKTVVPTPAKM